MMITLDGLPDDPSGLRATALAMRAELEAERALRQRLEDQNERLRHFIRQLQRMQFGRRSEKLDPDQLALALEDLEQAVAESDAEAEKADLQVRQARGRQRQRSRGALPEHLPRIEAPLTLMLQKELADRCRAAGLTVEWAPTCCAISTACRRPPSTRTASASLPAPPSPARSAASSRIHAILDTAFRTSVYLVCIPDILHIGCCGGMHRCIFEGSQL
jgi:transposase IS166 family protein